MSGFESFIYEVEDGRAHVHGTSRPLDQGRDP